MATSTYGTPYVQGSDLVSAYPTASSNLATRVDEVSYKRNGLNAQTGTTYTLVVGDAGKTITLSNAAAVAVTLPQDSVANLPTGAVVDFYNLGAGPVTISQGAGATLQSGAITLAQYDLTSVIKLSANTYGRFSGANLRSAGATVATSQSTTSTSYTDLTTAGPAVTLTTGTKALVIVSAFINNATAGQYTYASFAVSGATTIAASDTRAAFMYWSSSQNVLGISRASFVDTLTAGSNTFTTKYRVTGGTGVFQDRQIIVVDMGY